MEERSFRPDGPKSALFARTTPTIDGDRLYVMSGQGMLCCFNAKNGEPRWSVDTVQLFQAQQPTYGISESPVIAGDVVMCTPGGTKASVVGVDKFTGNVVWATSDVHESASGYNQPMVIKRGKRWLAVVMTANSMLGIDAADGTVYWRVPFAMTASNALPRCWPTTSSTRRRTRRIAAAAGFTLSADGSQLPHSGAKSHDGEHGRRW